MIFYGDHRELALRCLKSFFHALDQGGSSRVTSLRIGLNPDPRGFCWAEKLIQESAAEWSEDWSLPVLIYRAHTNVYKYPLMRRMFHSAVVEPVCPLRSHVMWLDDDTFFRTEKISESWWQKLDALRDTKDLLGEYRPWWMPMQGRQWQWIQTQSWFNPEVGTPPLKTVKGQKIPGFQFVQGGFWVAKSAVLRRYRWPLPEIKHNGGDSLFGELCRHQRLAVANFCEGMAVNADAAGANSRSARRGHRDKCHIGADYVPGVPLPVSHQEFVCGVQVHKDEQVFSLRCAGETVV